MQASRLMMKNRVGLNIFRKIPKILAKRHTLYFNSSKLIKFISKEDLGSVTAYLFKKKDLNTKERKAEKGWAKFQLSIIGFSKK